MTKAYPKMTLTGDLGSGKSAVSRLLEADTGYPIYSTGKIQREIAAKHGMTTLELNKYAETHREIDDEIDDFSRNLGKRDESVIVDSRLAWFFIPNSFKIYLKVDPDEAVNRIMGDNRQ
ncbi:MAG: dephospho-CoA kinase, partial [Acidobacteriota bacterium]|nr:dephospho-CoA kinase [Acidobacteriota bacterium]